MIIKKTLCLTIITSIFISAAIKSQLVEVIKINPTIKLDIRYATKNNFAGKIVYPSSKCYLEEEVALALDEVQKELNALGYGLKIFDGYRPFSVQEKFWEAYPNSSYVGKPERDKNGNPVKGSKHNRGASVDLTLIDMKTNKELVMPSEFDEFSKKASRDYDKMKNKEAKNNCKLLEQIMAKYGFVGLFEEWWHFNYKNWEKYPLLDVSFDSLEKKT